MLDGLGAPPDPAASEVRSARDVAYAPTRSRQVLGVMNDFAFMASVALAREPHTPLDELALWVARSPSKPIAYESPARLTAALMRAA